MGTFSTHLVLNPNPKINFLHVTKSKAQSISCTSLDTVKCSELEHDMKGDILGSSLSHLKVLNWKGLLGVSLPVKLQARQFCKSIIEKEPICGTKDKKVSLSVFHGLCAEIHQ